MLYHCCIKHPLTLIVTTCCVLSSAQSLTQGGWLRQPSLHPLVLLAACCCRYCHGLADIDAGQGMKANGPNSFAGRDCPANTYGEHTTQCAPQTMSALPLASLLQSSVTNMSWCPAQSSSSTCSVVHTYMCNVMGGPACGPRNCTCCGVPATPAARLLANIPTANTPATTAAAAGAADRVYGLVSAPCKP